MDMALLKACFGYILFSQIGLLFCEDSRTGSHFHYVAAILNASFRNGNELQHIFGYGKYGSGSLVSDSKGFLTHLSNEDWCKPVKMSNQPKLPWIALIPRGNCQFVTKVLNAKALNASAVVIFDNNSGQSVESLLMKCNGVGNIGAISISGKLGVRLAAELKNHDVYLRIEVGETHYNKEQAWKAGKTSVLFVLVSFILLMCISLAWLVFYYVQRFRYFYARDKKEKQLLNAAKKAISKLSSRICGANGVQEDAEESCAVCLEGYRNGETLRVLFCRHEFHKQCVDPWLLEHRTCPICKTNILKALGLDIPGSESGDIDLEESTMPNRQTTGSSNTTYEPATRVPVASLIDAKYCSSSDDEQLSLPRSITVNSSSTTDEESLTDSTSVLVSQGCA